MTANEELYAHHIGQAVHHMHELVKLLKRHPELARRLYFSHLNIGYMIQELFREWDSANAAVERAV